MTPYQPETHIPTETLVATLNAPLPFSDEAEKGLLSCLLQDPDRISEAVVSVPFDAFYHSANRTVYRVILDIHERSQPLDIAVVTHLLRERQQLEKVGGSAAVAELFTFIPIAAHWPFYVSIIIDKWLLRGQIRASAESIHDAYSHGKQREGESVEAILDAAEQRIRSVRDGQARGEFLSTPDWIQRAAAELQSRIVRANNLKLQAGPVVMGVPCGIAQIDERTNGIGDGCLWLVAAAPSDGKTALGIQVAVDLVTREMPVTCVYYLTESNGDDFWFRATANLARLSLRKITRGTIDDDEQARAGRAMNILMDSKMVLRHKPNLTVRALLADMRLTTRKLRREEPKAKIIHIVDYLQRLSGRCRGQTDTDHIKDACKAITDLTSDMQTGTILLAQLNEEGKIFGSNSPVMDADTALKIMCPPMRDDAGKEMVKSDRYGNAVVTKRDEGRRVITFGKNRMGERGGSPITLNFNGDTARFS